jgi:hypothetical protein
MSNALAIAATTEVLRNLLDSGLRKLLVTELPNLNVQSRIGDWDVTALPPDRVLPNSAKEPNLINLFMYYATTNQGWVNVGLPSRDGAGQRLTNPPLALDLHYLLIAYGSEKLHAETLLGAAMQILHEKPVLTRALINQILNPPQPPEPQPVIQMLAGSALGDQVELIKICPQPLNTEELSKLWTAFQSHYRPTAAYCLSVILVESDKAVRTPLPVLTRGKDDTGPRAFGDLIPPYPALEQVVLPNNQISAAIGDLITLKGHHLAGESGKPGDVTVTASLTHPRNGPVPALTVPVEHRTSDSATFQLNAPDSYPVGVYAVHLAVIPVDDVTKQPDASKQQDTKDLVLVVAPKIIGPTLMPMTFQRTNVDATGLGDATISLTCSPDVLPEQHVTLVIGDREIAAEPHPTKVNALTFSVLKMAAGEYRVRLCVDGIESHLIDRSTPGKPKFDESQKVTMT